MTEWIQSGMTTVAVLGAVATFIWKGGAFVNKIEMRFDGLEKRMDQFELRMDKFETRMDKFETRLDRLERQVNKIRIKLSGRQSKSI